VKKLEEIFTQTQVKDVILDYFEGRKIVMQLFLQSMHNLVVSGVV